MTGLARLHIVRKNGKEKFCFNDHELDFDLLSFWQCIASDLVSNATRGIIAEYIVARALGLAKGGVRDEWAPVDLETDSGIKVEVKSAAYVQTWHQEKLSSIQFKIKKTHGFNAETNSYSSEVKRQADVYVFAILDHTDKTTVNPLNLDQWKFYVLPASFLDARTRSQYSITFKSLEKLCPQAVSYAGLEKAVESSKTR